MVNGYFYRIIAFPSYAHGLVVEVTSIFNTFLSLFIIFKCFIDKYILNFVYINVLFQTVDINHSKKHSKLHRSRVVMWKCGTVTS